MSAKPHPKMQFCHRSAARLRAASPGSVSDRPAAPGHSPKLHTRGILYAPDCILNPGGLINIYMELDGYLKECVTGTTRDAPLGWSCAFTIFSEHLIPTRRAECQLAEERAAKKRLVGARPTLKSRPPAARKSQPTKGGDSSSFTDLRK